MVPLSPPPFLGRVIGMMQRTNRGKRREERGEKTDRTEMRRKEKRGCMIHLEVFPYP